MPSDLTFSIITAARNAGSMIEPTLRSIASQDYPHIEHLIVDGASTDDTLSVVSRHAGRVSRVLSEPDTGVYDAFNKGLRMATGAVVAYLNAGDTYADSGVITKVADQLQRSAADAVFGDVVITSGIGGPVCRRYRSSWFTPGRVAWGFMPAHPALFLRRAVYVRIGDYDTGYRIAGDFHLIARAFKVHGISYSYLPQILASMPVGGLSSSGWRSQVRITREMRRACRDLNIPTGWIQLSLRLPIKYVSEVLGR